jgi:endonuclease/exonuclease/phosphatase (EEP) superfamily protein YafD
MTDSPESPAADSNSSVLRRFILPNWQQRKAMLRHEAWLLVICAYPLFAFAYLWPQQWRNEATPVVLAGWFAFMVRVFQFHIGLALLLIVVVAAWGRSKRLLLAALPVMLFTLVPTMLQFIPRGAQPNATPVMRVMSANLLMVNGDTAGIIGEIQAAKPDVLFLQEYTAGWHEAIQKALAAEYPYSSVVMREDSFGIALYSRKPFAGEVDQRYPLGRAGVEQMRGEIDIGGKRFAIYNVHLLPPRTPIYTGEHRLQFADLVDTLRAEKLPYIVCGDFNFPETSPQHAELKRAGVLEAHQLAAIGRGATWPVNGVFRYITPGVRIDHIYLSPDLTATTCKAGVGRGSDHRPVVADLALRPAQ